MADKPGELAGTQRAAILLMSLSEQDAASVLKQITREQTTAVLETFIGTLEGTANVAAGSPDYVRRVLTQAVGKQKTDMLLDRVSTGQTGQGIEALRWMGGKG